MGAHGPAGQWRAGRSRSRTGAPTLLLAVVLVLLVPAAAFGDHGRARSTDNVCPPPDGNRPFTDVDEENFHRENIECIGGYEISIGYSDGTYRPALSVSRAQMASFIADFIRTAGESLPSGAPPDEFDDIAGVDARHRQNINALARAGVVRGRTASSYAPSRVVSRAQMASFIRAAIGYVRSGQPPTTNNEYFDDIQDIETRHRYNINRLAEQHIVTGVDAREYAPRGDVARGAMASFIMRAASYLEEIGAWDPVPPYGGATASWMIGPGTGVPGVPEPEVAEPRDAQGGDDGSAADEDGDDDADGAGDADGADGADGGPGGEAESADGNDSVDDATAFAGDIAAAPWYRTNAAVVAVLVGLAILAAGGLRADRTAPQRPGRDGSTDRRTGGRGQGRSGR